MAIAFSDLEYWAKVFTILGMFVGAVLYLYPRTLRFLNDRWNDTIISDVTNRLPKIQGSLEGRSELYDMVTAIQGVIKRSEKHEIKDQIEKATEIEAKLKSKLRYHIRVYLMASLKKKETKDRAAALILKQNALQSLFQFELGRFGDTEKGPEKGPEMFEKRIPELSNLKKKQFTIKVEETLKELEEPEDEDSADREDVTRVVITDSPLPDEYIQMGHPMEPGWEKYGVYKPDRFFIISLATYWTLHPDIPVDRFILRQIQRVCMRAVVPRNNNEPQSNEKKYRMTHVETRGCLFDFIPFHYDARYFTNLAFICEDCEGDFLEAREIPGGYRKGFLDEFRQWLVATLPPESEAALDTGQKIPVP